MEELKEGIFGGRIGGFVGVQWRGRILLRKTRQMLCWHSTSGTSKRRD